MTEVPMNGIYKIECIVNNKVYIGRSKDIRNRWRQHRHALNKYKHGSKDMIKDWATYGRHKFTFQVIKLVDDDVNINIINAEENAIRETYAVDLRYCCSSYRPSRFNLGKDHTVNTRVPFKWTTKLRIIFELIDESPVPQITLDDIIYYLQLNKE